MPRDLRVTAYIAGAAPFARPILEHIRDVVHRTCPGIDEAIKWGMPFFTWNGQAVANMAAFKAHAAFGFWRREVADGAPPADAMGQFGKLASIADLPAEAELAAMMARAITLVEAGGKVRRTLPGKKVLLVMPGDLQTALDAEPPAASHFAAFPPGARREYVEWVLEAKQAATRAKRIATTVEQCAAGKRRNWKYENC